MRTYVIPDRGLGAVRKLPVEAADTRTIVPLFQEHNVNALDIAVVVAEDKDSEVLALLFNDEAIGVLGDYDRRAYAELDWIIAAGLTPQVTVRATHRTAGRGAELTVRLPRPGLCLPDNEPPIAPWVLLPDTQAVDVDLDSSDEGEREFTGRKHWLVALDIEDDEIQASVDGERVGHIGADQAPELARTVAELQGRGLVTIARGYLATKSGQPALTIRVAPIGPVEELEISPLPPVRKVEAPRAAPVTTHTTMMPAVVVDEPEQEPQEKKTPVPGYLPAYQGKEEVDQPDQQASPEKKSSWGPVIALVVVVLVLVVLGVIFLL